MLLMAAPGAAEHHRRRSADLLQNGDLPPPVKLFGPFPTLQRLESVAGTEQKLAASNDGCLAALLLRDSVALSAHRRWVMMLEAEKLRLPDEFAELLDGREPRTATLREAGGEGRLWDVEVVSDGEGHMYLERGWEQFARAHGLGLGKDVLVFSHDGDAVLTVNVFDASMCGGNYQQDDANTGSNSIIDSSSNSSSSVEIGIERRADVAVHRHAEEMPLGREAAAVSERSWVRG